MKIAPLLIVTLLAYSTNLCAQDKPIVVINQYWAKEGKIQEVYAHRLYASEVRKKLGLPVGQVLLRVSEDNNSPHVIWQCEYPSEAARKEDIQQLDASGEFEPVMEKMGTLIDKFQRVIYEVAEKK